MQRGRGVVDILKIGPESENKTCVFWFEIPTWARFSLSFRSRFCGFTILLVERRLVDNKLSRPDFNLFISPGFFDAAVAVSCNRCSNRSHCDSGFRVRIRFTGDDIGLLNLS